MGEIVEFLVEFTLQAPDGTPESEVQARYGAEAEASAALARGGHLIRLWRPPVAGGERKALGLYRAEDREELDTLLGPLPLHAWMRTMVTPLEPHPNDPADVRRQVAAHSEEQRH
jgi:muconolactone D-isomerase